MLDVHFFDRFLGLLALALALLDLLAGALAARWAVFVATTSVVAASGAHE